MIFIRFSTSFGAFCLVFPCLPPGVCNETLDDIRMSSKKFITAIVVLITSNMQQKKCGINYGINVSKYYLALVESCILSKISYNLKTWIFRASREIIHSLNYHLGWATGGLVAIIYPEWCLSNMFGTGDMWTIFVEPNLQWWILIL